MRPSRGSSRLRPSRANAFAERWVGTLRRELLDRTVIWNRRQLERLAVDYIVHYNTHRPHRSLDQRPPVATDAADQPDRHLQVLRTARCGGLINEYRNAATAERRAPRRGMIASTQLSRDLGRASALP